MFLTFPSDDKNLDYFNNLFIDNIFFVMYIFVIVTSFIAMVRITAFLFCKYLMKLCPLSARVAIRGRYYYYYYYYYHYYYYYFFFFYYYYYSLLYWRLFALFP